MMQPDGSWRGRHDTYSPSTVVAIVAAKTPAQLDAIYDALLAERGLGGGNLTQEEYIATCEMAEEFSNAKDQIREQHRRGWRAY